MKTRAKLHEIENFGDENQYNKAVFLDLETMDKIAPMVSDKQVKELYPQIGKEGDLSLALVASGYDYRIKFKGFKAAV
jgi:hypothetical protein